MSALDNLLGPRRNGDQPVSDEAPRTLLLGDDMLLHLQEDQTAERVTLYSVLGRVPRDARLLERDEPWWCALDEVTHDGARAMLCVDHIDGDIFLVHEAPRARLDRVAFGEWLSVHAHRHLHWRALLANRQPEA
ncbi:hypothetical protein [Variovorax guangxiensis]|uniref:hypothetical protein n=1 Tax=Variovorax guangxiensis TaxID=1775474 RepID=UPI002866DF6C|nr:hypothetical protein [Variovorax guangxiensis]MDR6854666.1 hypothetical protein [Variovorax guangxiensis]